MTQSKTARIDVGEQIVSHIENDILQGKLHRGDKLPTERKMAEDFNASRASVREALRALESMGIVKTVQGSGNYITDDPCSSVNMAICTLFALNEGALYDIMQLRMMLEFEACKDIITYASKEDIQGICEAALYDYDIPSTDVQVHCDKRFHEMIMRHCRNTLIRYLYVTISALIDAYRARVFDVTLQRNENHITRRDHLAITDALVRRDEAEVERALHTHFFLLEEYRVALDEKYKVKDGQKSPRL